MSRLRVAATHDSEGFRLTCSHHNLSASTTAVCLPSHGGARMEVDPDLGAAAKEALTCLCGSSTPLPTRDLAADRVPPRGASATRRLLSEKAAHLRAMRQAGSDTSSTPEPRMPFTAPMAQHAWPYLSTRTTSMSRLSSRRPHGQRSSIRSGQSSKHGRSSSGLPPA